MILRILAIIALLAVLASLVYLSERHQRTNPRPAPAKPRAYLAGPITGYPDYNALTFTAAAIWAVQQGWAPVSPHDTDPTHEGPCPDGERHKGHPNACWYAAGCRTVLDCDLVVLLPDWRASVGARLEEQTARGADMQIVAMPVLPAYAPRHHAGAVLEVAPDHTPLSSRQLQHHAPTVYADIALPAGPNENTALIGPRRPEVTR